MKTIHRISLILAVLLLLTGCSSVYDDLNGTTESSASGLTPEGMDQISRELDSSSAAAAASKQNAKTTNTSTTATPAAPTTVGADTSDKQDDTATPSDTLEHDVLVTDPTFRTVYWTKGGSVWHVSRGCSALKNSTDILSGTEDEALAAGKSRVCKKCG